LKESGVASPLRSKEQEEADENDSAQSQNLLAELVREFKDQGTAKRSLSKREISAID
jgi:hypothetical protein